MNKEEGKESKFFERVKEVPVLLYDPQAAPTLSDKGLLRVPLGEPPPLGVTRLSASNLRTTSYCLLSVHVSVSVFVSVDSLGWRRNLPDSSLCLEPTSPEGAGEEDAGCVKTISLTTHGE